MKIIEREIAILLILISANLIATIIGLSDARLKEKLFDFYLVEAAGLYGYLQQKPNTSKQEKGRNDDDIK